MRFLAGLIVGALGVMAYQKKDELKQSAICLKDRAISGVKGAKEGLCAAPSKSSKKAK